jgi:two-component system, sporulation sensor kinase D
MFIEITKTKRWKIWLMLGAVAISVFFLLFTNYIVGELSGKELAEVRKVEYALEQLNNPKIENFEESRKTLSETKIPIIVVDQAGKIINFKNLDSTKVFPHGNKKTADTAYFQRQLRVMKFVNNPVPIKIDEKTNNYIYYKEQSAITLLRYFPYVQLLLIGLFLTISYVAFNTSTMYDQNKVWVGMAKETAHQIGTPLSSLMAWVEYLKATKEVPGDEILDELEKDIKRLEIITERFSKIGSTPELKPYNVYESIHESIDYLERRVSNKVKITIAENSDRQAMANINKNLFSWVVENLTKNAVDAMNGKGKIIYTIKQGKAFVYIDVKDTGKGMPRSNFQMVFRPGYTTKKRGWGLGLSLSKRIIENYHKGEIFVKDSEIGKGTTFRIKLKKIELPVTPVALSTDITSEISELDA